MFFSFFFKYFYFDGRNGVIPPRRSCSSAWTANRRAYHLSINVATRRIGLSIRQMTRS